jgi:hypothetical protein
VADELATLRRVPFGELRQRMTLTFATLFRP